MMSHGIDYNSLTEEQKELLRELKNRREAK